MINALEPGEVFVFGSNLAGRHGAGAAKFAWQAAGLPEPVSPADARVLLFIAGDERFVDEADLLRCRPHLRKAAEELLAD
jgi:hypothetical protein